jgi:hypothetical protein
MEKRLLGQRPKETLAEYHERLQKLGAEVERGQNVELWMRYEELLGEVKTEIGQETVLQDKLAKAQKAAQDVDRALVRQRRARNDPRIQIPEDERVSTRQRDELEATARQLQDELKALQNRHKRQPWKDISLNDPDVRRVGLFGELEMTVKAQEMGVQRAGRTVPPELIATPQELDAQFNKYKGQHGMDGIYTRPDPAHAGEEEFFVGESKTSGDPSPHPPTGKGELATTQGGLDQLSDDWIRSNLDKAGLTDEQRARFETALKNKRVRKFYAQTDKTGTHFYEVIDISSKEVRLGARITSF